MLGLDEEWPPFWHSLQCSSLPLVVFLSCVLEVEVAADPKGPNQESVSHANAWPVPLPYSPICSTPGLPWSVGSCWSCRASLRPKALFPSSHIQPLQGLVCLAPLSASSFPLEIWGRLDRSVGGFRWEKMGQKQPWLDHGWTMLDHQPNRTETSCSVASCLANSFLNITFIYVYDLNIGFLLCLVHQNETFTHYFGHMQKPIFIHLPFLHFCAEHLRSAMQMHLFPSSDRSAALDAARITAFLGEDRRIQTDCPKASWHHLLQFPSSCTLW